MTTTGWTYPVELRPDSSEYADYASSLPGAIAGGPTEADAVHGMQQALVCAVRGRLVVSFELAP